MLYEVITVVALRSRLVTSGRLAAVGELAAGIAHEINNPITYVRTNLSVLREHWSALSKALGGPVLERPAREDHRAHAGDAEGRCQAHQPLV